MRVVGHARVVPGVGERGLGDQQLASRAPLRLLRLQADAPAGRVEVHHRVAVVPGCDTVVVMVLK